MAYLLYDPSIHPHNIFLYVSIRDGYLTMIAQSKRCPGCANLMNARSGTVPTCSECGYVPRQGAD